MKKSIIKAIICSICILSMMGCGESETTGRKDRERKNRKYKETIADEYVSDIESNYGFSLSDILSDDKKKDPETEDNNTIITKVLNDQYESSAALPEIINADPADLMCQQGDIIYTKRYDVYYNMNIGILTDFMTDGTFPSYPVGDYMKTLENETSNQITWVDYNPDRLTPAYHTDLIIGKNAAGETEFFLIAYNNSEETRELSQSICMEMKHHNRNINIVNNDFPREELLFTGERYIFRGITSEDDKWNYETIKEILSEYTNAEISEHGQEEIYIDATFPWDSPAKEYMSVYNGSEMKDLNFYNTGAMYVFCFDRDTRDLIDISMYPTGKYITQ